MAENQTHVAWRANAPNVPSTPDDRLDASSATIIGVWYPRRARRIETTGRVMPRGASKDDLSYGGEGASSSLRGPQIRLRPSSPKKRLDRGRSREEAIRSPARAAAPGRRASVRSDRASKASATSSFVRSASERARSSTIPAHRLRATAREAPEWSRSFHERRSRRGFRSDARSAHGSRRSGRPTRSPCSVSAQGSAPSEQRERRFSLARAALPRKG